MRVRSIKLLVSVFCLMSATAFCMGGSAYAQGKKYALLIGLDNYRYVTSGIPTLKYAVADAEALGEVLEDNDYQVTVLTNDDAKREDIVEELNKFGFLTKPDDTFLLFFAGHGLKNEVLNKETYWLTYETRT